MTHFPFRAVAAVHAYLANARPRGLAAKFETVVLDRAQIVRHVGFELIGEPKLHQHLPVQVVGVDGIVRVLLHLDPVAVVDRHHVDLARAVFAHERFPARQLRRGCGPQVCEQHARQLLHLVCGPAGQRFQLAVGGFERLIDALAAGRELPAVIRAAQSVLFNKAVIERDVPVRAALRQQTKFAAQIAEEDQVLAHDAQALFGTLGG